MEIIEISVKDFLEKVAAPRGMVLSDIEAQMRDEMRCGESLKMIVGKDFYYIIPLSSIKEHFGVKDAPPAEVAAPVEKEVFDKIVGFGEEARTETAPAPAKPQGAKKSADKG